MMQGELHICGSDFEPPHPHERARRRPADDNPLPAPSVPHQAAPLAPGLHKPFRPSLPRVWPSPRR